MQIEYSQNDLVTPEEYLDLIISLELGFENHRSIENNAIALKNSLFIATARYERKLVGIIRLVGDRAYSIHVAEMAVSKVFQRKGIGSKLLQMAVSFAREIKVGCGKSFGEFTLFCNTNSLEFYQKNQFSLCANGMVLTDDDVRKKFEADFSEEWLIRHFSNRNR